MDRALDRGLRPVLAGRDAETLERQAAAAELPFRAFDLEDPVRLRKALEDVRVVLHCAGPFSRTSRQMADACLRTGTHYLDVTGEIAVFESLAARDAEARAAGVTLLPGVGFDVVPTDCLAAHLAERLPGATRLRLAILTVGGVSRGTATSMIENLGAGGMVRRDGVLTRVPAAWKEMRVDFGRGPRRAVTIPWGDVSTAYYSTGIPNIEVYASGSASVRRFLRATRVLAPVLRTRPVRRALEAAVRRRGPGPSPERRARGLTVVWGEVSTDAGERRAARQYGPDGYSFTALTAVGSAERVLGGEAASGFLTPSRAFGPDFVLTFEGVRREDVREA